MKILIVSDTHGRDRELEKAVEREGHFDRLIHCGDVEGRDCFIEALADCPCCMVSGNCDFFSDLPRDEELFIEGNKIFVTHGHQYAVSTGLYGLMEEARRRGCSVIIFGHTHRPLVEWNNGFLIVNPGSLSYPRQEGRKPTYAVMTTDGKGKLNVEIRCLDR